MFRNSRHILQFMGMCTCAWLVRLPTLFFQLHLGVKDMAWRLAAGYKMCRRALLRQRHMLKATLQ